MGSGAVRVYWTDCQRALNPRVRQLEESEAAAQVSTEHARWAEINQRLEDLDRTLARVPVGRVR